MSTPTYAGTPAVKTPLTVQRCRRRREVVENDEYGAFARRIVTAYARRVANGDVEALPVMVALSAHLDEQLGQAVVGLRGFGYSWAEIGTRLGLTRQAVQQRWGTASTSGGETR